MSEVPLYPTEAGYQQDLGNGRALFYTCGYMVAMLVSIRDQRTFLSVCAGVPRS